MNESLVAVLEQIQDINFSKRLCLNMIVKNESRIIERLLTSVLPIIDSYCICDTGSTDDTIARIESFMEKAGKPGIVFSEPFRNFGYNRTVALEKAQEYGEYALLLDADMKLHIEPGFRKDELTEAGYNCKQGLGALEYWNTRIIKTGLGIRCVGPTHEYYEFPAPLSPKPLSTLWIEDIGDGGAKADKFIRDIRLLTEALVTEPNNQRYLFYLANSYKDNGQTEEAIVWYKKRLAVGGWIEEVFYTAYEIGNMYSRLGKDEDAVFWWLDAYNRHPARAESLYEIIHYYRLKSKHALASLFLKTALFIPFPKDDTLFIRKDVYDTLLYYEYSIVAYYTKEPIYHFRYLNLLGSEYNKSNVLSNYRFYVQTVRGEYFPFNDCVEKTIDGVTDTYTSSTPCIQPYRDGYLMNVRYVNYKVNAQGGYDFRHTNGKIATLQKTLLLDKDFQILSSVWKDRVHDASLRYQGIEDVKYIEIQNSLQFIGTVEHNGTLTVGVGAYDIEADCLFPTPLTSPSGRSCEKNWALFEHDSAVHYLYEWSPLTILDSELREVKKQTTVPAFFRDLRGSSNGFRYKKELWFLTHLVHYDTPRYYYHMIVILDAETLDLQRHSCLFKLSSSAIEYALGLIVEDDRLVFSYSTNDASSIVMSVTRPTIDTLFG